MNIKRNWKEFSSLIFCILLAAYFILRCINLLAFWLDEAAVALVLDNNLPVLWQKAVTDIHPPFYIALLKVWSVMFGLSEVALRSFSAFFGVATVVLLYFFGKNILKSGKIGFFAGFLGATNYMLIWFSTQTRPYTMVSFFSLLSVYYFIKSLKNGKKIQLGIYTMVTVLGLYVHIWMILVFVSELFSLFLLQTAKKAKIRQFIIPLFIIFIFGAPSTVIYYLQNNLFGENLWIDKIGFNTVWESLNYMAYGSLFFYISIVLIPVITIVYTKYKKLSHVKYKTVSLDFSFFKKFINGKNFSIFISLTIYLFFPFLALILISLLRPVYVPGRYEMVFLPALILFLAWLVSKQKNILAGIIFTGILLSTNHHINIHRNQALKYKSTDKTVIKDILLRANKNDMVIATDLSFATMKYYARYFDPQNSKNITYVSYPEETQIHPGYKRIKYAPYEEEELKKEADKLLSLTGKDSRIFILYNSGNPVNEILFKKIGTKGYKMAVENPPIPRESSWFDKILIVQNSH